MWDACAFPAKTFAKRSLEFSNIVAFKPKVKTFAETLSFLLCIWPGNLLMDILRDSQLVIFFHSHYFYNLFFFKLTKFETAKTGSGVGFLRLTGVRTRPHLFSRASRRLHVLLWILIGPLDCLCPLWLASVITLVWVLRHLIESCSRLSKSLYGFH